MVENQYYLEHHGIKGMKWGIRRYQNEDGSYTDAGKRRYGMNLDIDDKSRRNIAKIRLGEARRRYDVAKNNNDTNKVRLAELKGRVKTAKRVVRSSRSVDKGAALAAKGKTVRAEKAKELGASFVGTLGPRILTAAINDYKNEAIRQGAWDASKHATAGLINKYGSYAVMGVSLAYAAKKKLNAKNINAYYKAKENGTLSIKGAGSDEYAAVVKRRKGKG